MKNLLVKGGGIGVGSSRAADPNPTTPRMIAVLDYSL